MELRESEESFARAVEVLPGGVSSPVRAFGAVGGTPVFVRCGAGCRVEDVDGNVYVDYVGSYGPLIAGHANERVLAAISKVAGRGTTFGCPTTLEIEHAETILSALPGHDLLRFVNSGTEAAMSSIRLARAATGRDKIIKCVGCYHGHVDALLVEAGSGAMQHGTPSSPGVTESLTRNTLLVDYNDLEGARKVFEENPDTIACFAVEPIAGNMGLVEPEPGYLQGLRDLCDEFGALLLFDEVMTGFRVAWGGAQTLGGPRYGVQPDLTCLGKVIGGGLPAAAYAGRRELLEQVSPTGPVYQAGTLSGNPLAMAAGAATLDLLKPTSDDEPDPYDQLEAAGVYLEEGLKQKAEGRGVPITINRVGSMMGLYLTEEPDTPVTNFNAVTATDARRFATFFHELLVGGVMIPPSRFESWFLGLAHDEESLDRTLDSAEAAFAAVSST
ncbi:MAG: glutamate-1-semialdehyde 2,1-aminomutase [Planctomycetota bacterium]